SQGFNDLTIERRYVNDDGSPHSVFSQNTFIKRKNQNGLLKLGADYTIDKYNTIGFVFNGNTNISKGVTKNDSYLYGPTFQLDSLITADNTEKRDFTRTGANLNYRKQYKQAGRELGIDLDYVYHESGADQLFKNASYKADNSLKGKDDLAGS